VEGPKCYSYFLENGDACPDDLIGNRPQGNLFQQYVEQAQDANKQIGSISKRPIAGFPICWFPP